MQEKNQLVLLEAVRSRSRRERSVALVMFIWLSLRRWTRLRDTPLLLEHSQDDLHQLRLV
jgi:hypothetical protein